MITVVGDVLVDVVVRPAEPLRPDSDTPASVQWRQGGAAANVAACIAELGHPVVLRGRVGDDPAGAFLRDRLAAAGAGLVVATGEQTGTVVAIVDGQSRHMLTDRGASGDLSPTDLPAGWLDGTSHVHVSGYALLHPGSRAAGVAALEQALAAGTGVSVDPASAAPLRAMGADAFLALLPGPVLLTPNAEEAEVLTGLTDPVEAARALGRLTGEAVVTDGPRGAVWSDGGSVRRVEAAPVDGPVDPVGAGDAFLAGLLVARAGGVDVPAQLVAATTTAAARVGGAPVS